MVSRYRVNLEIPEVESVQIFSHAKMYAKRIKSMSTGVPGDDASLTGWHVPVLGVLCVGLLDTDHNENVLEVGADATWGERFTPFLLKDHCHNVIANVPLPQQL